VTLVVLRQATFEEITQALIKKHGNIPPELHDRIRLFDVRGHKDYKEFQPLQTISTATIDTSYGVSLFAEPIPREEDEAGEQDKLIIVVHFSKDLTRLHGIPIKFVVKPVCQSTYVANSSVNYGTTRRNGYKNDWDIKIKNSQGLNSFSCLKHIIILLKLFLWKMVCLEL
jgi:Ubiquitin-specific protease C-terminal